MGNLLLPQLRLAGVGVRVFGERVGRLSGVGVPLGIGGAWGVDGVLDLLPLTTGGLVCEGTFTSLAPSTPHVVGEAVSIRDGIPIFCCVLFGAHGALTLSASFEARFLVCSLRVVVPVGPKRIIVLAVEQQQIMPCGRPGLSGRFAVRSEVAIVSRPVVVPTLE